MDPRINRLKSTAFLGRCLASKPNARIREIGRRRMIGTLPAAGFVSRLVFPRKRRTYAPTLGELRHRCRRPGVELPQPVAAPSMRAARAKVRAELLRRNQLAVR